MGVVWYKRRRRKCYRGKYWNLIYITLVTHIQILNQASRNSIEESTEKRKLTIGQPSTSSGTTGQPSTIKTEPNASKPIDRMHTDAVLNFLLRLACQVNDPTPQNQTNPPTSSPGDLLSRRCVLLLKTAVKPEVWPQPIDLKLAFFDKILQSIESTNPNIGNICTALELLTFLLTVMKKEQILANFKSLQKGLGCCIQSSNSKVIKLIHTLLHKLMAIFPAERTNSNIACKYEELDVLYSTVGKVILDGLTNYEKNMQATPSSLFGTLMILKACCINNNSYIDLMIIPFMRVLHRLAKEHLSPTSPESSPMTSELLILGLDLVKTRVVVMNVEMRKTFIGTILVGLIEKTPDIKVMKAITKMLEEWMKNKDVVTLSQAPSTREKSILLVKMMQYVEKRFPDDTDLNAQFLELINYVYVEEQFKQTELISKLEPAFLAGLRCNQPHIRSKFFKVFDESMMRRLHDRILYIICSQNWESIGPHFWIKQCIELILVTVTPEMKIQMSHESSILPSISSVIASSDPKKKEDFESLKIINPEIYENIEIKEEILDMDLSNVENSNQLTEDKPLNRAETLSKLLSKHYEFIEMSRKVTTDMFMNAAAQLCHMDTGLAEQVWLDMFPR